ncbi:MAG: replication initiator protein A [Oscillospiraceae bacterium]|nr:replication initiator protein A [Oscillospiraceae bacterium]
MPYFKKDTVLPPFIPLPRFIVAGEYSVNAKLLYGLLLSRTMLSQKSGWVSEDGSVYVVYPSGNLPRT